MAVQTPSLLHLRAPEASSFTAPQARTAGRQKVSWGPVWKPLPSHLDGATQLASGLTGAKAHPACPHLEARCSQGFPSGKSSGADTGKHS